MTEKEVDQLRELLQHKYKGCHVKVAEDRCEMVAEISEGFAVAVIERSVPHFHQKMDEEYRLLQGTLLVSCGGLGRVLRAGDSMAIPAGQVHFARSLSDPAWIEVKSVPPWSADDHFAL